MRQPLSQKAFTLIEIMLVMAMIGILALAAFYMGGPYLNRSRDVARFTDISQYGRVIDLYYKDHDTIPSNDATVGAYGYCADEVFFERTNVAKNPDQQFEDLAKFMG
jgi:prepilin-type N-terminal cleavage/methylation domain-containing protein